MGVRWIRLDVTWSQSDWLADLPASSRLAWIELLCYVKANGVAGSVKRPSNAYLARTWGLSKSSIETMFSASFLDGAIVSEGSDLIITGWASRQMDGKAAERVKAYRERQKGGSADPKPPDVTDVTRNERNTPLARVGAPLTLTLTETGEETKRTTVITSPPSLPSTPDRALEAELRASQPTAKTNIIAIHGGTEDDVRIGDEKVGVGRDIARYKELCREGRDPPEIIAAAIAFIPSVSNLEPPVSLARWYAADGRPIYEQCVGQAYKEAPQ